MKDNAKPQTNMLAAALNVAKHYPVFPCKPDNKAPYTPNGFKDATKDPAIIKRMWKQHHDALIGVPTGAASGLLVLDLDRKPNGHDGVATWNKWVAEHGAADTLVNQTPSTGEHQVFNYREFTKGIPIKNIPLDKLAPGIEVKAEGGYVIFPPSRMANGKEYIIAQQRDIADEPPWLQDKIDTYVFTKMLDQDAGKGIVLDDEPYDKPHEKQREPIEKIEFALDVYPSDNYWPWFETGCALYDEMKEAGYPYWEKFSHKSKKFNKIECRKKWEECKKVTGYHIATVYGYANKADPTWYERYRKSRNEQTIKSLLLSSAAFVAAFVPPDYTIDGLLQRRFLYALTGPTNSGKTCVALRIAAHKALGLPLDGRGMDKGRVLFFAGENPDDVRMRWIKLCEEMDVDPEAMDVHFLPGTPNISSDEIRKRINTEVAAIGPVDLLIVDTSAAYYTGEDENDRVQMGRHARMLRSFTQLPGGPTVLVTCHPIKNFNPDRIIPSGGGTFLNEVDGNLVCQREPGSMIVEIHWHEKYRGLDFAPIGFVLQAGTTEKLKDTKGRMIPTITAAPISDAEQTKMEQGLRVEQDELLSVMKEKPGLSFAAIANELGWSYNSTGKPNRTKVQRALHALSRHKLVENKNGVWQLTRAGSRQAKPWQKPQGEIPF